ncbi:glycosyltransferase family 4 protein [Aurantiacibacter spongiae]|uniref:Glycosyltransferase WbuB n=1 Tax=Aurantiacibacter spongiae TaxID=2488860 RepID=A0A3N5DFV2_9SPHN|nr:glycosyltransferase family 4 protein [Aurantiacibacter spongiae]RPF70532.1 glycosyltransferase WbuB [Aurantiacibacter spongiae]
MNELSRQSVAAPRLIFVNRYFWPDRSATSQILSDIAFYLVGRGYRVEVIASRLSYEGDEAPYPANEVRQGVVIHRVTTPRFGRANVIGRVADYLGFYIGAFAKVLSLAREGDVVIAKTDPPVLSAPVGLAARLKRARRATWLQDLYPEVAEAFAVLRKNGLLASMVRASRDRSLRDATMNIAIGERMAQIVRQAGVKKERIVVIPNMTDDEAITPVDAIDNPLRREWGFGPDDLVVGYSGNLGRAHEVDTVLDAAERLEAMGRDDIRFLVIGGGYLHPHLEAEIARRGLTNFVVKPYQPRERLNLSLTVPDVHWVSLRPALEGLIVPSKFYGAAASGRPVVFIGDSDGEIAPLVHDRKCGAIIEQGASDHLVDTLCDYADRPQQRLAQGRNARSMVVEKFSRRSVYEAWDALVDRLLA